MLLLSRYTRYVASYGFRMNPQPSFETFATILCLFTPAIQVLPGLVFNHVWFLFVFSFSSTLPVLMLSIYFVIVTVPL